MAFVSGGGYKVNVDDLLPKKSGPSGYGQTLAIEGAAELDALLERLTRRVANKIRSQALRAGAKIVLARAKQLAPRKTGLLRRSLKVKAGKRSKGFISFRVQTADGDYKGDTFYGAFLEFGHKIGNRKHGTQRVRVGYEKRTRKGRRFARRKAIYQTVDTRRFVPPQKYLEPAFEQTKDAALQAIIVQTRDGIIQAGNA